MNPAITVKNFVLMDSGKEMSIFNINSRSTWIPALPHEDTLSVYPSKCHKPSAPVTFLRKKYLFGFIVSEILVHSRLVPLLWSQNMKAVSHFEAIQSREKERSGSRYPLQELAL